MLADPVVLIAYSEIALKGRKRGYMERYLMNTVKLWLIRKGIKKRVRMDQGRIVVEGDVPEGLERLPGVHHLIKAYELEKLPPEELAETVASLVKPEPPIAVRARRADKRYPLRSVELAALIGERLNLPVNLSEPKTVIYVEVRDKVYVYTSKDVVEGVGGLPYGVEGRVFVAYSDPLKGLLASALLARRGAAVYPAKPYPYLEKLSEALPRALVIRSEPLAPAAGDLVTPSLFPGEPCVPVETLRKVKLMLGGEGLEDLDRFGCARPGQGAGHPG